jgi:hypothetical protein
LVILIPVLLGLFSVSSSFPPSIRLLLLLVMVGYCCGKVVVIVVGWKRKNIVGEGLSCVKKWKILV